MIRFRDGRETAPGPTRGAGRHTGLILRLLRDGGPTSRARLAEVTGLSPTTITKNVADLLRWRWVEEIGSSSGESRVGRPAIDVEQRPGALAVCGIQIGVGVVRVGLADGWASVGSVRTARVDPAAPPSVVLDEVAAIARAVIEQSRTRCIAVGVAAPGPVDGAHRVNLMSINLGWREVPIADRLEAELGLPVIVDHNVRGMALAEARYGRHGHDSLAYLYAKAGVGLGLVLKNEPFFGGSHGVSELGHVRVRDGGERCICGSRGCLETVAAEPYLLRRLAGLGVPIDAEAEPILTFLERQAGAPNVRAARDELIGSLSRGIAVVVSLLNPAVTVLGGILADASEEFIEDLCRAVRDEVFPLLRDDVRLVRPTLPEAGISAGAAVALEATAYADPE